MSNLKYDPSVGHPQYEELLKRFKLCSNAVMGNVEEYVEEINGQTKGERKAYVSRPAYFDVVSSTTTALVGAMTRKNFVMTGYDDLPQNDMQSGNVFVQSLLKDILLGARVAILVTVGDDGMSKLVSYDADDIVNWSNDFAVIKECTLGPDKDNPFLQVVRHSWLELYMDNGVYQARRWFNDKEKDTWVVDELETMEVNGKPLNFIPLSIATPYDNTWAVYSPPLYTQATLNISHFKQSCDLYHYAHFMALPTFTIVGGMYGAALNSVDEAGNPIRSEAEIRLGSTKEPLHLELGASAQLVEASGASFGMLQNEIAKTEERMFAAGSRLLTSKKGIESAEALQIRSGSESALLETVVTSLEAALNQALVVCGMIDRVSNPSITLNRDFTAQVTDPTQIKALLELYIAKAITLDQLTSKLIQGEVIVDMDSSNP